VGTLLVVVASSGDRGASPPPSMPAPYLSTAQVMASAIAVASSSINAVPLTESAPWPQLTATASCGPPPAAV
jgi:hypothetical protein